MHRKEIGILDANLSYVQMGGSLTRVLEHCGFANQVDREGSVAMKGAIMGTNQRVCSYF